jgi:SAM-dependent methyltransferase
LDDRQKDSILELAKNYEYWIPIDDMRLDERVRLTNEYLPLKGLRVLEPGCLDGYVAISLVRVGAVVTSFDIRPVNVVKSVLRGLYCNHQLDVWLGDAETMHIDYGNTNWDLILHGGVFYHLKDPVTHFKNICRMARYIHLDTHTAIPGTPRDKLHGYRGMWSQEMGWNAAMAGKDQTAFWLEKEELLRLFADCRCEVIKTLKDEDTAKNGPRSWYLLKNLES